MNSKAEDTRKVHLQDLLNEVSNSIVLSQRRYIHIHTIENLIFHFDNIKIENDKTWVYENLLSYFKGCLEIGPSIERRISQELFFEYIDKLTDYYYTNLGFSVVLNRNLVYILYISILIVGYFLFNNYILRGLILLFAFLTYRTFKKYKEKRVYGLFW